MKKQISTIITIAVFPILTAAFVSAQQPRTVLDFYLALPKDRYSQPYGREIKTKAELVKYRRSLITVEDIKNGYIKLGSNGMEGWSEFALFKKTDGTYIFAVSEISCGPACNGNLELLIFKNEKWTDVTEQFSPDVSAETNSDFENYWELPRAGKTLVYINTNEDVREESDKLIYTELKFNWNGSKFVKK